MTTKKTPTCPQVEPVKNPLTYSQVESVEYRLSDTERKGVKSALDGVRVTPTTQLQIVQEITRLVAEYRARTAATDGATPTIRDQRRYAKRLQKYHGKTGQLPPREAIPPSVKVALAKGGDTACALADYEYEIRETKGQPGQPARPEADKLIRAVFVLLRRAGVPVQQAYLGTEAVLIACGVTVPAAEATAGGGALYRAIERDRDRGRARRNGK